LVIKYWSSFNFLQRLKSIEEAEDDREGNEVGGRREGETQDKGELYKARPG
jgi:hypothetical protein